MHGVDPHTPIESTIQSLSELVKEGQFRYIGLSEVSEDTVRRAHAVYPITAVEVEYSLWSTHIEVNGVLQACEELGIPVVAYSPLGRGFLTGQFQKYEDIPIGDNRRRMPRFQPDVFDNNIQLVKKLELMAKKKNVTAPQLALAWILAQKPYIYPIQGAINKSQLDENLDAANIKLNDKELDDIRGLIDASQVQGERYPTAASSHWTT